MFCVCERVRRAGNGGRGAFVFKFSIFSYAIIVTWCMYELIIINPILHDASL